MLDQVVKLIDHTRMSKKPTAKKTPAKASTKTDDGLAAARARSLGHVLFECARLLDEWAQEEVNRQAGERVARPAFMRLLPFLDTTGIRPTELASRVDVTKQAVGQSLAALEAMRFVEVVPDPTDGRATLVRLTKFGVEANHHGLSVLSGLERQLEEHVGREKMKRTFDGLTAMHAALAERRQGYPGHPKDGYRDRKSRRTSQPPR